MHNPQRYGLTAYCSKKEVNAGYLTRLIPKGVSPSLVYNYPAWFDQLKRVLTADESSMLDRVWNRQYFNRHRRKITFNSANSMLPALSWNMTKVKELNDEPLKRLIKHQFGFQYDQAVASALKWYLDKGNSELIRHVHYACYYGMADTEMSKRWRQPIWVMRMIRLLFFDYSHLPSDRLARFSFIRQLVASGELDDTDYHRFRRIFDLGKLGLDSILGCRNLTIDEQQQIEMYLGSSVMDNTLDLRYTITNRKEALEFNRTMQNMAEVKQHKLDNELKRRMMAIQLDKLENQETGAELLSSDEALISFQEHVKPLTAHDAEPVYPTIIEIKQAEESK
ncbi:MAG: hypothetical protein EBU46_11040 [Nitrosomonadaceae bacterium]|nr:hypothetical protein [Nitrosomonadaceae bacterium]